MDNVENIPKAMVDGLRSLDPNELTIEEAAALDYADEQEQIQQNNRDAIDEILDAIQGMPNAPGRHEIEAWQGQFGVVYVSSVSGSDIYLWRTISRNEYKQMARSGALNEEQRAEESIVRKCLLFPSAKDRFMIESPAGVIRTINTQILYQSGFVSEQEAIRNIKEL